MSIFVTSDPKVVPICIRLERILPDIEKLAGVKSSKIFRSLMMNVVDKAHRMASSDPTLLKGAKKAGRTLAKLEDVLQDNPNLAEGLEYDLEVISDLAERSHKLERLHKGGRPKKWAETIRKQFVFGLLDAVYDAGGELSRSFLVKAKDLLLPLLPNEFRYGLNASTLRKLKAEWQKTRKNDSKKREF